MTDGEVHQIIERKPDTPGINDDPMAGERAIYMSDLERKAMLERLLAARSDKPGYSKNVAEIRRQLAEIERKLNG